MQLDIRILTSSMSNVGGRFATGTVLPTVLSSHSSPTPLNPAQPGNLPSFAHIHPTIRPTFIAWCPRVLLSCCTAGSVRCSAHGRLGKGEGPLLHWYPLLLGSPLLLSAEGNLPAHILLNSTSHINPVCVWVPALQLVWKVRDSLAYHLL